MIQGTYGRENASVVIVGDALTKWEYDNDIILHSKTRDMLYDFLDEAGFDPRDTLYVPCFSGSKLSGLKLDGPTLKEDAEEWLLPIVRKHPRNLVLALGNNAACALGVIDKPEGINSMRSKRLSSPTLPGIEICAALHPRLVMEKPDDNGDDFRADLTFANRVYNGDFAEQVLVHIIDLEKPDMIFDMFGEAEACRSRTGKKRCCYDIETTGLNIRSDLVVTMAFANGLRTPDGAYIGRFWGGFDRLKPRFEDHVLDQFSEAFADFFNEVHNHYDEFGGHNSIAFDDEMVEANLGVPIKKSNRDTRLDKYTVQKYGKHGLKENVTRYLGYTDYDAAIDAHVKAIAERRGRLIYEFDEFVEGTTKTRTGKEKKVKGYSPNPLFQEDLFVCEWAGIIPEFSQTKNRGRKWKWPEQLDKKFAAWAMVPYEDLRLYNVYDAVYTWLLADRFDDFLDDKLKHSNYWRHKFAKYLIQATNHGMLMDVETNRSISKQYAGILEKCNSEIQSAVLQIDPTLTDFNANSQPQLRKALFGDPIMVPHIDNKSLEDYFDWKSVKQNLDNFHEKFYRGFVEVIELQESGEYSHEATSEALKKAFKNHMGSVGNSMVFERPSRLNRDDSKIYAQVVDRAVYANGLYVPDPKAFTKGGQPSVSAQVLKNLYKQKPEPLLHLILMRSKASKLRGTFVDGIYKRLDENNVLHSEYNATGPITGRLSSRNPNGQNFTKDLRGQLIARPGYRLLTWDLSQAEVRVMAAFSQDTELMQAVYSEDFHSTTAMMMFNLNSISEVTKQQRQFSKTLNFMVLYGGSAYALAMMLGIEVEAAEELLELYFGRFPKLKQGLDNAVNGAYENLYTETAFGTRTGMRNLLSSDKKIVEHTERLAMNAPVQGTSGELTLYFIDQIQEIWNATNDEKDWVYLVNTTHDSATFEVPEHLLWNVAILDDEEDVPLEKGGEWVIEARGPFVDLCRQVIEETPAPFPPLDTVKFKCDIEITDCWYGEPDPMKAVDPDYGTEKQTLPWHLILGDSDDKEEKEEIAELIELEEAYYGNTLDCAA